MRVLHLVTRFLAAGSERNIMAQMEWEVMQGDEVHLAVGHDSTDASALPDVRMHQIPSLGRSLHPLSDVKAYLEIRDLVEGIPFDLVHTHQSKAGILGRRAARGRAALILHTVHMASFGPGYSRLASMAFSAAERFAAPATDVIVCVGDELQQAYLRASIGRASQYRVIRSPIDIDRFAAVRDLAEGDRAATRDRLGVRAGARLAVSIGALEPRKRHALIVRELAPLLRAGDVDLLIAGEGPARVHIEGAIESLNLPGVRLLGHVSDIPSLLGAVDVLVHASTAEGVPQVVIQALAAGVPVVGTDVIGLREVAGAPVSIVSADGADLAAAVRETWDAPRSPAPLDAFAAWRPQFVQAQLAQMRSELSNRRTAGAAVR